MTSFKINRLIQLCLALLFMTATTVNAQAGSQRPKKVPPSCDPRNIYSCPKGLACGKSSEPGVGYCTCAGGLYGYTRLPPKVTDGINDPFVCDKDWNFLWHMLIYVIIMNFYYNKLALSIYRKFAYLLKTKAYNPLSANGRIYFYLMVSVISSNVTNTIYLLNFIGLDPGQFLHDEIRPYFLPFLHVAFIGVPLELPTAWIDIVLKSITMSRNSMKGLVAFQYFLRFGGVFYMAYVIYLYLTGQILKVLFETTYVYNSLVPFTLIAGYLIRRVLCPTMDKNHANYKSALAIRSYSYKYAIGQPTVYALLWIYILIVPRSRVYGYIFMFSTIGYQAAFIYFFGTMNEYIMYGYRKALKDYDAQGGQTDTFKGMEVTQMSNVSAVSSASVSSQSQVEQLGRKSVLELPKVEE